MSKRPATIADRPDALTAAWLTQALASSGRLAGAAIQEFSVEPLGTGQMCDSARIRLTYSAETTAPATLVAKLPAADETSRTTAVTMRSYEKEVCFYRELGADLDIRIPDLYYADIDETGGSFVLLLEDLAPAVQGDQLLGCSSEVARAALGQLVGLHAPRWADDRLHHIEWLRGDVEAARERGRVLLPLLWNGFVERYAAEIDEVIRSAGEQLFGSLDGFLADVEGPRTVVHGDYRLDNLLIHPSSGDITVVDWQTCSVGNALSDVAYFLGAGLAPDDRRTEERELVRAYHRDLEAAGVGGYGWDTCWLDYRRGTWAGLLMAVGASMLVERTARGDRMFLTMASRHARHALDLEAAELLG